jgi:hypothetical protein
VREEKFHEMEYSVPAEIGATLLDIVAGPRPTGPESSASLVGLLDSWSAPSRDRVIIDAGDMAAIVTNGWHLVASHPHGGGETGFLGFRHSIPGARGRRAEIVQMVGGRDLHDFM